MKTIMRWLRKFYLKQSGLERISPNDWLSYEEVKKIETIIPNSKVFGVADTGSMDGLMDFGHNAIGVDYFDINRLTDGDIIIYQIGTKLICHRIVEVHRDGAGPWYITQGDNCVDRDPFPVRAVQVKYIVVGIIF